MLNYSIGFKILKIVLQGSGMEMSKILSRIFYCVVCLNLKRPTHLFKCSLFEVVIPTPNT
jgi:hypothetical protein